MTTRIRMDVQCDGEVNGSRCPVVAENVVVTDRLVVMPKQIGPQQVALVPRPVRHFGLPQGWSQAQIAPGRDDVVLAGVPLVVDITTMSSRAIASKTGAAQEAHLCPFCTRHGAPQPRLGLAQG